MSPALERRVRALIVALDDCFSLNGQAANLRGILHQQPKLRAIRKALAKQKSCQPPGRVQATSAHLRRQQAN